MSSSTQQEATDPKKSTTLMKKVYSLPSVLKRNSFDSAVFSPRGEKEVVCIPGE